MKRNLLVLLALIVLISCFAESQTYLNVLDPRFNTNFKQPGSIREFIVTVKPRGIYIEYEMYITFNSKGSKWSRDTDTLEIEYFFDLPESAFMIDSWLWYNNIILRARLIDIWTASQIYENIVHRIRRDPSIIYKHTAKQYEMRIFPMVGDSYRKVKISYMAPATWSVNSVIGQLPLWLVNASSTAPEKVRIITYPNKDFTNPRITETSDYTFTEGEDKEFGHYYYVDLLTGKKFGNMSISFDTPVKNGVYVNYSFFNNESIYQMVFFPTQLLDFRESRKILFLADNEQSNTSSTGANTEDFLENLIYNNITDLDSFNVMFSGLEPKMLSSGWIGGDKKSVETAMGKINNTDLKSYSNLPSLFNAGVDFLNKNGKSGNIILISSSSALSDLSAANDLIGEIMTKMMKKYPIYVADFANLNLKKYVINNLTYYGNEYFYTNLCRLTGGALTKMYGSSYTMQNLFQAAINSIAPEITNFDYHTSLKDGLTYGKFNLSGTGSNFNLNQPIMQVGKSVGQFPLTITAGGFLKDKVFTKTIELNDKDISFDDYKNNQIWNALLIKTYESKQTKTNHDVLEIIDLSKANRVLSFYTAFLALETDVYDSTNNSTEGEDDDNNGDLTSVIENDYNESVFNIYPNPFSVSTSITISLPKVTDMEITGLEIYDMLGRKVKTIDVSSYQGLTSFSFRWQGDNEEGSIVQNGAYILVVSTPIRKYSVRLIKI